MSRMVACYEVDGDTVCKRCTTDVDIQSESAVPVLRVDSWIGDKVRDGVKCSRCESVWRGTPQEGDWS